VSEEGETFARLVSPSRGRVWSANAVLITAAREVVGEWLIKCGVDPDTMAMLAAALGRYDGAVADAPETEDELDGRTE
jgi:hypothetical protein